MSELRWHPLLEEWVTVAPWRQDRTYHPAADHCPLCPTRPGHPETEIPEPDYHIAVFENRFPSFTGEQGRCEVVCYTPVHDSSLGEQSEEHIRDLIEVWRDRTEELGRLPNVRYVYIFENRGEAIGVTLSHPHGQIYAYPFVPPVIERELRAHARHKRKTGRCLYCDVLAGESGGGRTVLGDDRWIAFVPPFARWPYEVHIAPRRHRTGLLDLDAEDGESFARILKGVLQKYDRLFDMPLPYVMAMHQRPPRGAGSDHHFHVEFYPPNRSRDKLKYLAGSELGAGAFILDARAEDTAVSYVASKQGTWNGRAPGRVNLIGEHVDYMGGVVLPAAVDRHTEVSGHAADEWSMESRVKGGLAYLRAVGEELGAAAQAVRVRSDIPAGSGLSSSAALLVAVAAGLRPDMDGAEAALACQRAEQRATGVQVGVMDQFASALGRRGHALLLDCATLEYRAVPFPDELLIAVIDSGEHRSLAHTPYNDRRREAEAGQANRRRHVDSEIARVHAFVQALEHRDFEKLGELLNESHRSLRDDFEVSTPHVDALVEKAWAVDGCFGARIMGAGFGGSILALIEKGGETALAAAVGRPVIVCTTADGAFAARAKDGRAA